MERLFVRYRRRGDRRALAKVFDRAAPELLRVAIHLARDPAEAEDLVQASFLAAIERAESYDPTRRLMPWLMGILTNQARLAARRTRRTIDGARLARRPADEPTELAERREARKRILAALDELEEPYREVVTLKLIYDLEPAGIAHALGRAPGTVRSQLHRGLERVRRRLPAGLAVAMLGVLPKTRGLATVRAEVLAKGAWNGVAAAGGIAMGKKTLVVAVAFVLALSGTAYWHVRAAAAPEAGRARSARAALDVAEQARSESPAISTLVKSPATPKEAPGLAPKSDGKTPARISGKVFILLGGRGETGSHIPKGATVVLTKRGAENDERRTAVSEAGAYSFDDVAPGMYFVRAVAPAHDKGRPVRVVLTKRQPSAEIHPFVSAGAGLRITVQDGLGNPVRNASISIGTIGLTHIIREDRTDDAGVLLQGQLDWGVYQVEVRSGGRTHRRTVALTADAEQDVVIRLGLPLSGVVILNGTPLKDAVLRLHKPGDWTAVALVSTTTDSEGRYEVGGLPPEQYDVLLQETQYGGFSAWGGRVRATASGPVDHVIEIRASAITGRVTMADTSAPPPQMTVQILAKPVGEESRHKRTLAAWLDKEGAFSFLGLPAGSYEIVAQPNYSDWRHSSRIVTLSNEGRIDDVKLQIVRRRFGLCVLRVFEPDGTTARVFELIEQRDGVSRPLQPWRRTANDTTLRLDVGVCRIAILRKKRILSKVDVTIEEGKTTHHTVNLPKE